MKKWFWVVSVLLGLLWLTGESSAASVTILDTTAVQAWRMTNGVSQGAYAYFGGGSWGVPPATDYISTGNTYQTDSATYDLAGSVWTLMFNSSSTVLVKILCDIQ